MQQRRRLWNFYAVGGGKVIEFNFRFRGFERPGHMVNVSAQQLPTPIGRKQTISLGEKMLDRPRSALVNCPYLTQASVVSAEPYRLRAEKALTLVGEFAFSPYFDRHTGPMIGQTENRLGHYHR